MCTGKPENSPDSLYCDLALSGKETCRRAEVCLGHWVCWRFCISTQNSGRRLAHSPLVTFLSGAEPTAGRYSLFSEAVKQAILLQTSGGIHQRSPLARGFISFPFLYLLQADWNFPLLLDCVSRLCPRSPHLPWEVQCAAWSCARLSLQPSRLL